jgi:hypothetical protein
LNGLRQRCEANAAISVDTRQRYGQLLGTLEEQQQDVALYVLGRRGESAAHTRARPWTPCRDDQQASAPPHIDGGR